ncbi:MAG TPA: dihydrodipicolinate synthase family protein [Streptosporangiaceae bacterium]|nr:dihydrodipicolinate synthase family protein [Streptosporangiaceae bacterium]
MRLEPAIAERFRGALATVAAIPVTPFGPDGTPDWDCHGRLIGRLIDAGITLVTPNGNTGEFYTLSAEETEAATESAIRAARDRAEVLVGVGHDIAAATRAATHARTAGARMIMIHQPVSPYMSADGWVDYHAAIAEAVPDMGVVLYIRDPRIAGRHIRRLGELCPNVVGVKYGVRDQVQFAGVARDAGLDRFTWLAGLAELTAPGCWAYGARGFTSGLVNVAPRLSLGMLEALRGGDAAGAMKLWEECRAFEELRAVDSSADNVSVVKEALAQLGLSRRDVRPPSRLLPEAVRDEIGKILAGWGLEAQDGQL